MDDTLRCIFNRLDDRSIVLENGSTVVDVEAAKDAIIEALMAYEYFNRVEPVDFWGQPIS